MIDTREFFSGLTALVVIDLQRGVVDRETAPHTAKDVVTRTGRLVEAFHGKRLPVVFVRVSFDAGGGDALAPLLDDAVAAASRPAGWDEIVPDLGARASDTIVTKRNWGAFYGTDLDLQLRRRSVTRIVLCGISTNIGVESTARDAYERNYPILFVEDAMAAMTAEEHAHAVGGVFRRMGIVRSSDAVVGALAGAAY
ncbi:MAG TPA: hydrolase [Candidatus Baltobacteraceae bacterium]|jgi:nicotinamidase-related amidase